MAKRKAAVRKSPNKSFRVGGGRGSRPRPQWWKEQLGVAYYSSSSQGGEIFPVYEDSLVSYWKFDQDALDYAGSNHGTRINMSHTAGKLSDGFSFDGNTTFVSIPDAANLSFSNGVVDSAFSWSMWINPTNLSAQRWLISKRLTTTSNVEYQIIINQTTGTISVFIFNNGLSAAFLSATSGNGVSAGAFSNVLVTYDGSGVIGGISIYINGVAQSITDGSSGTYSKMIGGTSPVVIGQRSFGLSSTNGFVGVIDEVALWSRELTQEDVDAVYNGGDGLPYNGSAPSVDDDLGGVSFDTFEVDLNVLATRDSYAFASDGINLFWSNDCGETWINETVWGEQWDGGQVPDKYIEFAYIFSDGTVIFACGPLLFRSTDQLQNIDSITPFEADGVTPYTVHTPTNADRPGSYFQTFNIDPVHHEDDIFAWINYCNEGTMGASPVVVWATTDKGLTVRAIYKFGQNPTYRDNGGLEGSSSAGNLLGDSGNSVICRHGHSCTRNPGTNDWYSCTGDGTSEIHWFKHTYNSGDGSWTTTQLVTSAAQTTKWKACSLSIIDGEVYWASDATGSVPAAERGLFKTPIANIGVSATRILNPAEEELTSLNISQTTGRMLFLFFSGTNLRNKLWMAKNEGPSAIATTITGADATHKLGKVFPPDANGYYKVNVGITGSQEVIKTVFVHE